MTIRKLFPRKVTAFATGRVKKFPKIIPAKNDKNKTMLDATKTFFHTPDEFNACPPRMHTYVSIARKKINMKAKKPILI